MYTSSITDMSGSSGEFPAPMFEPECVMVLNVTASVLPDTINITATSMGGNIVAVVRHPKPKSLRDWVWTTSIARSKERP